MRVAELATFTDEDLEINDINPKKVSDDDFEAVADLLNTWFNDKFNQYLMEACEEIGVG